jgi:peptidoglycan/LPS O-acetylase OafA/YrhL
MGRSKDVFDKKVNFSYEIEALRGIASLQVVLGHFYLMVIAKYLKDYLPGHRHLFHFINGITNPQPAVLLFFTISGLVLGRMLENEPTLNFISYLAYLCRRLFRLVPLMIFTSIIAFIFMHMLFGVGYSLLISTFLFKDISINVPLWSLHVEIYCSILFPFIYLIFKKGGLILNVIVLLTCVLLSIFWDNPPIFLQFFTFFYAGMLADKLNSKFPPVKPLFFYLGLVLFVTVFLFAPQHTFSQRNWTYGHWHSWVIPEIFACPLIVLSILKVSYFRIGHFFRLPIVRYFGKISFSLYLIHFAPLLFLDHYLSMAPDILKATCFVIAYFVSLIIMSSLTYHWIELPANNLGKKLSQFILLRKEKKKIVVSALNFMEQNN